MKGYSATTVTTTTASTTSTITTTTTTITTTITTTTTTITTTATSTTTITTTTATTTITTTTAGSLALQDTYLWRTKRAASTAESYLSKTQVSKTPATVAQRTTDDDCLCLCHVCLYQ